MVDKIQFWLKSDKNDEIWYLIIFKKVDKIQVWLKSEKNYEIWYLIILKKSG